MTATEAAAVKVRRKAMLMLLAIGVVGCIACVIILRFLGPVLYAYREPGDPRGEPVVAVFNPLRDRAPERPAEGVLAALMEGNIQGALAGLLLPEAVRNRVHEKELEHPLSGWTLKFRQDGPAQVRLLFLTARHGRPALDTPVWITVERADGDDWQVVDMEGWY